MDKLSAAIAVGGEPRYQAALFDMGLFHVEHGYLAAYGEMARVLRQRNALLKARDPRGLGAWNQPFADAAKRLHSYREPYIAAVFARVEEKLSQWKLDLSLNWQYRPGWDLDHPFVAQLEKKGIRMSGTDSLILVRSGLRLR